MVHNKQWSTKYKAIIHISNKWPLPRIQGVLLCYYCEMARGKVLELQTRHHIYSLFKRGLSPDEIHRDVNNIQGSHRPKVELVSIGHLKRLGRLFRTGSKKEMKKYLSKLGKKTGRRSSLNKNELRILDDLNNEDDSAIYEDLAKQREDICGKRVSQATILRGLLKIGIKRKMYTIMPGQADIGQQVEHMKILRHVSYERMVNVDETHDGGGSKAACKRGRSRQRAIQKQFIVDGKRRTYMAAVSLHGILKYARFDENCSAAQFVHFVEMHLSDVLTSDQVVLYDNASTHMTDAALIAMENATGGNLKRVPAYCHWLSPVERLFAMVWGRVRRNKKRKDREGVPPLDQVDSAFVYYMVGQPGARKCRNLFNVYKRNNEQYRRDLQEALRTGVAFV